MAPHDLLALMGDETRFRILHLIWRQQPLCVCELAHALQAGQPKISRHLALLRAAGLVRPERHAQWILYRLAPPMAAAIASLLDAALAQTDDAQARADLHCLNAMEARPAVARTAA